MPVCLKRIQPMPNLPLGYVSVYVNISYATHTQQCDWDITLHKYLALYL